MNTHDWFYVVSMLLFFTWGFIAAVALSIYLDKKETEKKQRKDMTAYCTEDASRTAQLFDYPDAVYTDPTN